MNTVWIDKKYMGLVSTQLDQFSSRDHPRYDSTFRCPYCGDSQKSKFKRRGHVYEDHGKMYFKCFNCGTSTTFGSFLRFMNQNLYREYKLEVLKESGKNVPEEKRQTISVNTRNALKKLTRLDELPPYHKAIKYIKERQLPENAWSYLYYAAEFKHWVNTLVPDKFDEDSLTRESPRIVIPFIGEDGELFAIQGRAVEDVEPRYIMIIFNREYPRIFGLDRLDRTRKYYLVEGPLDSLFLDNCVAMGGAEFDVDELDTELCTVVMDNEPRNKEIVNRMHKYVTAGFRVCFWPGSVEQKDINEMILAGMDQKKIKEIIDQNSHQGLQATLELTKWRKV